MARTSENRGSYDPATDSTKVTTADSGGVAAAKVTDPDAATATTNGLLRGILETLQTIATNTTPA